jgi:hypothetical protein
LNAAPDQGLPADEAFVTLAASHASLASKPVEVSALIDEAAKATA